MNQLPPALYPPDPGVRIRPVLAADSDALHRLGWPERSRASVDQLIARVQQYARDGRGLGVVVVDDRDAVRGYGQLLMWPRTAEISDLFVAAPERGRGLGTAIIQYLTRSARDMNAPQVEIGAALSNPGALRLYRRLGFADSHQVELTLDGIRQKVQYLKLPLTESASTSRDA